MDRFVLDKWGDIGRRIHVSALNRIVSRYLHTCHGLSLAFAGCLAFAILSHCWLFPPLPTRLEWGLCWWAGTLLLYIPSRIYIRWLLPRLGQLTSRVRIPLIATGSLIAGLFMLSPWSLATQPDNLWILSTRLWPTMQTALYLFEWWVLSSLYIGVGLLLIRQPSGTDQDEQSRYPPVQNTSIWVRRAGWSLAVIGLIGWAVVMGPLYLSPGKVLDETWFDKESTRFAEQWEEKGTREFLRLQDNYLGYGAAYWITHAACHRYFDDGFLAMRGVAFTCMLGLPLCFWLHACWNRSGLGWGAVLLWLSTPMAWWYGKLTGPELISISLALLGVVFAISGRRWWRILVGGLFLGLALGVKVNTLPMAVFAGAVGFFRSSNRFYFLFFLSLGLLHGFILANPFALNHPDQFIKNLSEVTGEVTLNWDRLALLYQLDVVYWDASYGGNLITYGLAFAILVQLVPFLAAGRLPLSFWIGLVLGVLTLALTTIYNPIFYGWYCFPIIPLMCLALCSIPGSASPRAYWAWSAFAMALVAGNLVHQHSVIRLQLDLRQAHVEVIGNLPEIEDRLDETLTRLPVEERPRQVIDLTYNDIRLDLRTVSVIDGSFEPFRVSELIRRPGPETISVAVLVPTLAVATADEERLLDVLRPMLNPFTPCNPRGYRRKLYEDQLVTLLEYQITAPGFDEWYQGAP